MKKQLLIVPALVLATSGMLNAQTIIFSENFEGTTGTSLPAAWTQTTLATDGGWKTGTTLGSSSFSIPSHTRYMATNDDACNCNKSNDFVVTPSFTLTGTTSPKFTFDVLNPAQTYQGATEKCTVEITTNGGSSWTVLETLPSLTSWTNHSIDLTPYIGQTVQVGFRYNDGGGWLFGCAVDNVVVLDPPAKEGSLINIIMNKYVLAGNQTISTVFKTMGGPNVTSTILKYSVDGGTPVQQTFNPNVSYGNTYTANFTTPANLTAGIHAIKAWITDINGTGPDATPANDTAKFNVTVQATKPAKKVLVEEFTGAWCGYCPRGGVALGQITADTNIIGAAIHDNDNMSTTEGNTVISAYASGFPSGMVDRAYFAPAGDWTLDNSQWQTLATSRLAEVVPATVSLSNVTYNSTSRQISVTVNATFVASVKGAFSINTYVVENNVYGPLGTNADNSWNQHSYYFKDNTSPFYHVGYMASTDSSLVYLRPNEYIHHHVVDKMAGGPYGDNTVVPTSLVTAGTTFTKTFTYTLPAADPGGAHRFHPENVYLIGTVAEYDPSVKDSRYILNVTESKLVAGPESPGPVATSVNEIKADFGSVSVYPNPASTLTNIMVDLKAAQSIKITIYDALGQLVRTEDHVGLDAGQHIFDVNTSSFTNGVYNIIISTKDSSITKKITVAK